MSTDDNVNGNVNGGAMRYKAPPAFNEKDNYADWKLDLELWKDFTSIPPKKMGTALLLELKEGKVKQAIRSLGKEVISADDGLDKIITHLDKIYEEEAAQVSYRAYSRFEKYERPSSMDLQSYIAEFEKLLADLKRQKIILPEEVMAYRVLNSASLPPEKVDLALATVKSLTYKDMCTTISKIFSIRANHTVLDDVKMDDMKIKSEPEECNYIEQRGRFRQRGRFGPIRPSRGFYRGKSHPYAGGSRQRSYSGCYSCGQQGHFARECTGKTWQPKDVQFLTEVYREDDSSFQEKENDCPNSNPCSVTLQLFVSTPEITLVNEIAQEEKATLESLVFESLACAVIDSGCTQTVVGRNWLDMYSETMDEDMIKLMKFEKCNTPFKFGHGKEIYSKCKVNIPGHIGNSQVSIDANVVDIDLPLLLSKSSMKKAGAVLNFQSDNVVFNGETIKLQETKSGHYCVPICNKRKLISDKIYTNQRPHLVLTLSEETLFGTSKEETLKKAEKLHRQFSHASADKLITLLKTAGFTKKDYFDAINSVCSNCEICLKYKRPKPRPVVGLPRGKVFNDCVAMDLKSLGTNVHILHMIDTLTRYSSGKIIYNKNKDTVAGAICSSWIAIFGNPNKYMADNGGEFANSVYDELCEQFNIEIQKSAAESPFSNGMVERHHKVLTEMLLKTKEETKCSWEVALAWALNAKNSVQMTGGFSAYQLTMGYNPSLPNVISNKLPAMGSTVESKIVEENLRAMHHAREQFMRCESSNKIKRALRCQVRTCNDQYFDKGEKIFYKRNNSNQWHGPGKVLGQDGQCIIVQHGNQYVKVHPCHASRASQLQVTSNETTRTSSVDVPRCNKQVDFLQRDTEMNVTQEAVEENGGIESNQVDENGGIESNQKKIKLSSELPKPKTNVVFKQKLSEESENHDIWDKAYVHSRAGKANGKYKNWLNIQIDGEENVRNVDWTEFVDQWKEHENAEVEEVLLNSVETYKQEVTDAKLAELTKFSDNRVYMEVENKGQPTVGVRWVITRKQDDTYKARLVALGYQECSDNIRKDSPTCNKDSLRILLLLTVSSLWKIRHIDVQAAFLQGKPISREVFIKPPKEAETTQLWKLLKCIYGLVDGPRKWYEELRETLENLKMCVSMHDESLLFYNRNGKLEGIIAIHVDDLMFSGNETFLTAVITALKAKFKLSSEMDTKFVYTGLTVTQNSSSILLSQSKYTEQLSQISIDPSKFEDNTRKLSNKEMSEMRSACGALLWIATQTRPDISYGTCVASNSFSTGTVTDLKFVNKTIKYAKNNPLVINFPKLNLEKALRLLVFCDASFGNLKDGSSQGGFILFLVDVSGNCAVITWQSKKIKRVCKSTLAAESWAMIDAIESSEIALAQLKEVLGNLSIKCVCFTDCKSLHDAVHTTNNMSDRGLRIPIACLRQRVNNEEISIVWVGTKFQLADCLTKAGASPAFLRDILSSGVMPNEFCKFAFFEI